MPYPFCCVSPTEVQGQNNTAKTRRAWIVCWRTVSGESPFYVLMLSQDDKVHHNGNYQPGNAIHLIAAVWRSRAVVVHLGQSEPPFRGKSLALCLFVLLGLAVSTILLPTTVRLGVQVELLGLTCACGMATFVQRTSRARRSLKDLATAAGFAPSLQGLSIRAKRLWRVSNPGDAVSPIPSITWLGVGTAGDMPHDTLLIQLAMDLKGAHLAVRGGSKGE